MATTTQYHLFGQLHVQSLATVSILWFIAIWQNTNKPTYRERILHDIITDLQQCLYDFCMVRPLETQRNRCLLQLATLCCDTLFVVHCRSGVQLHDSCQPHWLRRQWRSLHSDATQGDTRSHIAHRILRHCQPSFPRTTAPLEPRCGLGLPGVGSIFCL